MAEKPKPSDWEVKAVIDRKVLGEYTAKLVKILAGEKVKCVVSAVNEADALKKAEEHFHRINGISPVLVKAMYARKLPT
jgi:hypothetical protein